MLGTNATDGILWIDVRPVGETLVNSVPFFKTNITGNATNIPSIWNIVEGEYRVRYVNGTTAQLTDWWLTTKESNAQSPTLLTTVGGTIDDNTPANAVIAVLSGVDANGVHRKVPVDEEGQLAVNVHDQVTRSVDFKFGRLDNLTTLSAQADPEDMTLTLTSTTGFVDGTLIGVFDAADPEIFYLGTQVGAPVGNVVTLDTPIDRTLANTSDVAGTTTNMAVDGSVTTQIFQIGPVNPLSTATVDVTRIMGSILDSTAMDDGKFGGIPALTNGIVLRKNDGVITNYWNIKTNADLALLCFDFSYSDKAPGGQFGCNWRNTYGGQGAHGVVLEIAPAEYLEILIQDDLTGLDDFKMLAQGHFKF